jgi:hypothetical protein
MGTYAGLGRRTHARSKAVRLQRHTGGAFTNLTLTGLIMVLNVPPSRSN